MALDRYLAIVHAVRSIGWRTVRNSALAIAATWVTNYFLVQKRDGQKRKKIKYKIIELWPPPCDVRNSSPTQLSTIVEEVRTILAPLKMFASDA